MNELIAETSQQRRLVTMVAVAALFASLGPARAPASAATLAPPMLDITHQCETIARRNVTAMSECVVAESEARAEILQKWGKLADAAVEQCVKLGRKARRYPYSTMAKCLSVEPADMRTSSAAPTRK